MIGPKNLSSCAAAAVAGCLAWAPGAVAAPPNASFTISPSSPYTLEPVTFTSTSTGDVTNQSWDLDNQNGCNDATGPTAQRSFSAPGTYRIALCVSGPDGESAQAQNVVVKNQAPAPSLTHLPRRPKTGEPVTFVSTSEDPDGEILGQAWDLDGDGDFGDSLDLSVARTFQLPGTYVVGLMVIDSAGEQAVTSETISIRPSLLEPFPRVAITGVVGGGGVDVRALEVDAPDGARVRIRCRGPGCPEPGPRSSRVRRFSRFERQLGAGALLEVFVTKRGTIGKYTRFKVRVGSPPTRRDLCLFPGRARPRKCPSA